MWCIVRFCGSAPLGGIMLFNLLSGACSRGRSDGAQSNYNANRLILRLPKAARIENYFLDLI